MERWGSTKRYLCEMRISQAALTPTPEPDDLKSRDTRRDPFILLSKRIIVSTRTNLSNICC